MAGGLRCPQSVGPNLLSPALLESSASLLTNYSDTPGTLLPVPGGTHLSETFSEPTNRLLLRRPARVPRKAMSTTRSDSLWADEAGVITLGRGGGREDPQAPPRAGPALASRGLPGTGFCCCEVPERPRPLLGVPWASAHRVHSALGRRLALADRKNSGREVLAPGHKESNSSYPAHARHRVP